MNNDNSKELTLKDILYILLDHKNIIISLMCVCFVLCFVYFRVLVTPTYTSSGVVYVSCMSSNEVAANQGISEYEIQSSRELSTTYMEILNGRSFLKLVSADMNYKYSIAELSRMISVSSLNETELLRIKVTCTNAEDAYLIGKSIMDNAPTRLLNVFKRGSVEIVDNVEMPTAPSRTGISKIFVLGVGMGFILGAAIAFLIELFDTKVRNAPALIDRYDITVLGEIVS